MPPEFIYEAQPNRVIFGAGTLATLPDEVARLKLKRPLIVSSPSQAARVRRIADVLTVAADETFTQAALHTPLEVTDRALSVARGMKADGTIAIGGGSSIGLSKAISSRLGVPQIVLPTTYAGSEMTSILGETKNGVKETRKDAKILPDVVIYDVELTMSLPPSVSAASGLNGIAHAVEALYAPECNPVVALMAEEGTKLLFQSLPRIVKDPTSSTARADALRGAWLCGACLGMAGMGLHHKLCHVLGGLFNLSHSEMHAVILPYALAYNAPAISEGAMERLRRAVGTKEPAATLRALQRECGVPLSLAAIGMPGDGIDKAVDAIFEKPYANPRTPDRDSIRQLVRDAYSGKELG